MDRYFVLFHLGLMGIYTGIGIYGFYWVHEWLNQQVKMWSDALSQARSEAHSQMATLRTQMMGAKHNTRAECQQYTDAAILELAKKIKDEMKKAAASPGVVRKRPMARRKVGGDD